MSKVFFISAGQLDIKKERSIKNTKNMYLNYGALLLASIVKDAGFNTILIHGHFKSPIDFTEELLSIGIMETKYPIFISIPSFFALSWVNELTKILKNDKRIKTKIHVGGRWVIDDSPENLKKALPYIDDVISGLGENKILPYLTQKEDDKNHTDTPLNYNILYERELFQPSIEVSRGCGKSCFFCQERNVPLTKLKEPDKIVSEYKSILLNDSLNKMNLYFECSNFKPNTKWINELIKKREDNNVYFNWRTESRVDSINIEMIPLLAKAGLTVIDLGLESASKQQLQRMDKTKNPDSYLKKASLLLKECKKNNIKTKVNIMLYAGETMDTVNETMKWLNYHRDFIYGVSVGCVLSFGWSSNKNKIDFIEHLKSLGASVSDRKNITGITRFNLSNEINYEKSSKIAEEISEKFMSLDRYFYLKSFSYYPRNYTKEHFLKDISFEKK
ncbi:TPA: B12-binding domain-containing radical SAM protein [Morganella morganii]